jgi:hypothetical protein
VIFGLILSVGTLDARPGLPESAKLCAGVKTLVKLSFFAQVSTLLARIDGRLQGKRNLLRKKCAKVATI